MSDRTVRWHDDRRGASHTFTIKPQVKWVSWGGVEYDLAVDPSGVADLMTVPKPPGAGSDE